MSHLCRRPSLVSYIASWLLAFALGLRRWWLTGRPVGAGVEREPRRRDLFRPSVRILENREGPTGLFGLAVPGLGNGAVNLDNLGGGGSLEPQGGALVRRTADPGAGYAAAGETTASTATPAASASAATAPPADSDDLWDTPSRHNPAHAFGPADPLLPPGGGTVGSGPDNLWSAALASAGLGGFGRGTLASNRDDSSLPEAPGPTAPAQAKARSAEHVVPRSLPQRARHAKHTGHPRHRVRSGAAPASLGTTALSLLTPPPASSPPARPPASGSGPAATPSLLSSPSNSGLLVTGPDAGGQPLVKAFDAATQHLRYQFLAYDSSFHGGVRVAVADVNGDGTPDVICGTGPGGGSQVRVFDGTNGTAFAGVLGSFNAFAAGQTDGVFVAAGDVNLDGKADLIIGTDVAAQPQVKVTSGADGSQLASFTLDTASFSGGVRVAAGDVNGDGKADILVAAGAGGPPTVEVFDGVTDKAIYNFFAFEPTYRGGVFVAAGDVSGDGLADIICGAASGTPQVRVFSGMDTAPLGNFTAYASSFAGGVRLTTVDANNDGLLDIATGQGPDGGEARLFDGRTFTQLDKFKPYGGSFHDGFFIAGDATASPGVGPLINVNVSVAATTPDTMECSSTPGVFTFTRTGSTGSSLTVNFTLSGTATSGSDYTASSTSSVTIPSGSSTATVTITPLTDSLFESVETVVATLGSGAGYTPTSPTSAAANLADCSGPAPVVPDNQCCGGPVDRVQKAAGISGNVPVAESAGGVRYFDGTAQVNTSDLSSSGFGVPWGQDRSWTNGEGYASTSFDGTGAVTAEFPYLQQDSAGSTAAISNGTTARFYDVSGSSYVPRFFGQETLSANGTSHEFTQTDTTGNVMVFADFSSGVPANERGQLKSFTDPDGNVTSVTSRDSSGRPTEVQRSNTTGTTTVTESYLYTYLTSGVNAGQMSNVTLRRQVNSGSWTTVRQVDYTYYDGTQSFGNAGDLMKAVVRDASGNALDTKYARYYTAGQAGGYQHGLRYEFGAQSYARLAAAFSDPTTATDAQVAPYADLYLEYDSVQRVTKETVQGEGCSSCTGGLGTYTFGYTTSGFPDGYNNWRRMTLETLPDGNQNIVYTNYAGEVMLSVYKETSSGNTWPTYYHYDNSGRLVLQAQPSAVSGYDDTRPDLLNNQFGNYQYLRDSSGLITVVDYASSTTATSTTAGDVAGHQKDTKVQRGETGTAILQNQTQYIAHTGGSVTVYPVAAQTVYRNTDGTGGETTSYAYTWFSSSTQPQSVTVTLPTISSGQNGPGSADVSTVFLDLYGRPIWTKDEDGFLNYLAYDQATGAVSKTITDVDTSHTSDFSNLPSGWSTPTGAGLHLISQREVDSLGRTTKLTDPKGNITYTVYNDPNYEARVYPGWNSTTNLPTGPTQVMREDRPGSYTEMETMSATPHLTSGRPDGTESISSLQTLARSYTNSAGQLVRSDAYFNLSGVTYSTAQYIGTQNTNFYTTLYAYDDRGWQNRVQLPTGTIERTIYDGLGRVVSTWVGTNDTPSSGYWSPSNNTSPANMVQVTANVYDGGGVGDSLLTQVTALPGGSATNRVTQYFNDWRDRLVASKAGVQTTEGSSTHRPILYVEMDNLGEVTAKEQYDGDGVSIVDANSDGVPDKPSSSLLRARRTSSFDDQGRVYRTQIYSVNPSSGSISTNSLTTDIWFNHRGLTIKTVEPGGLVTKMAYDGAGRTIKTYSTDGGGDSGWSDAGNVSGDAVLTQTEKQYDADSNVIFVITKDRFHDETATGELGNTTTSPKARVFFVAAYIDAANRVTDSVNVGTNGGGTYTLPSSVPARSDTVQVTSTAYTAAGWVDTVTDPRGLVTKTVEDNLGRTTKTVEAYDGGSQTNTTNKTTEYTYDGSGNLLTLQADLPGGSYEQTQFVYSVTTSGGSDVNSNDILSATRYPDKNTGNASSSEQESVTVNALGEVKTRTDRNGTVHTYVYDVLGRTVTDTITTLGTGVDGSVRRLEIAYDTQGNPYLFTNYDASSGGNIVNQVQQAFNGLGQLTAEYQSHNGAVNTSTTPAVQYAYVEMASGANNSRPTSMTYPNGKVLSYNYGSGLDSTISRLSSVSDSSGTLEAYSYLGLSTVVLRSHPELGIDLTYVKQTGESNGDAGDQYIGLDRFGRVADQRWLNTSTSMSTDRFQYGYDRDSNPLYRDNLVNSAFGELYHANGASNGYDSLNQLSAFARGTLSDTNSDGVPDTVASASRSLSWSLDGLGNFSSVTSDGTAQSGTYNKQNEETAFGGNTLTFDANGNLTTDETGKQLVYDAWNRLAAVKSSGGTTLVSYQYDALGRRGVENSGTARDLYYSAASQVLEERVSGASKVQYVWSAVYVDALVLRDRDSTGGGTLNERLWVQQDTNWNVTALVNGSGSVVERYVYDPYGKVTVLTATWGASGGTAYAWIYFYQRRRYDSSTGLYWFGDRDFSPTLGRWLQKDSIGFEAGDVNQYRFMGNNPDNSREARWPRPLQAGGGTLTIKPHDTGTDDFPNINGVIITFNRPGANLGPNYLKVKQWMMMEVYATYQCPGKDANGKPCTDETTNGPHPPGYPLDPKPVEGHGHSHETGNPFDPILSLDHGGLASEFSPGPYPYDPTKPDTISYYDDPNAPSVLWPQAVKLVLARWGWTWKNKNGKECTLDKVRLVERFVTIVFLNGVAVATYHWTATSEGRPDPNNLNKPGNPIRPDFIGQSEGEQNPVDVIKSCKAGPR